MDRDTFDRVIRELSPNEGDIVCISTITGPNEVSNQFYKFVKSFSGYIVVSLKTVCKRGRMPEECLSGFTHEQVEFMSIIHRGVASYGGVTK